MEFPPNAFSPEQAAYLARVLRELDLREQRNTKAVNTSNNGVTVTASSAVIIPDNCDYFILSGVSPVATFSYKPLGYRLTIRLSAGTILTHSDVSLLLKDKIDRVSIAEGIIELVSFGQDITGAGLWKEVGDNVPSIIDLTGYTGADFRLCIGQKWVKNVTAITTHLLRTATGDKEEYILRIRPNWVAIVTATASTNLQPNNANTGAGAINRQTISGVNAGSSAANVNENVFILDGGASLRRITAHCCTSTNHKNVEVILRSHNTGSSILSIMEMDWNDTTTPWSSLGTVNLPVAMTGEISVERVL